MKKFLLIAAIVLVASSSFAGRVESATNNFRKRMMSESRRVLTVFDDEIKRLTKKGSLEEATKLSEQKKEFIDKVNIICGEMTDSGKALSVVLKGKVFAFGDNDRLHTNKFKLSSSGKITGYKHKNEAEWGVNKEGKLIIFNAAGKLQWTFVSAEKKDGKWNFMTPEGIYLKEM